MTEQREEKLRELIKGVEHEIDTLFNCSDKINYGLHSRITIRFSNPTTRLNNQNKQTSEKNE